MPPTPKIGSVIPGRKGRYCLNDLITEGNMSWALRATDLDNGNEIVFLKYYKSPTPTVSWYNDYLRYVERLNTQLQKSDASKYCVLARDLFTANPKPGMCPLEFFYSTYDFIEGGYDLKKLMEQADITWFQRKNMAKIFLVAMKKIHSAKVVHCDLKPENVQMLPDKDSGLGYLPRMIDMDFSILENQSAPWSKGKDKQGYTGTPGYFSPEHLSSTTPTTASDVFTIGIILGELLCGVHPFNRFLDDPAHYKEAVLAGNRYQKLTLLGDLAESDSNAAEYARLLERCFAVKPADRPSADELHRKLLELDRKASTTSPPPAPPEFQPPPVESSPAHPALKLSLQGDSGEMDVRLDMDMGSVSLSSISTQARFAERRQFRLERVGTDWCIAPCPGGQRNLTAWNGAPLQSVQKLSDGDTICLMGKSSGKKAMILKVILK